MSEINDIAMMVQPLAEALPDQIAYLNHCDWSQFEIGFTMPTPFQHSVGQFVDDNFVRMV